MITAMIMRDMRTALAHTGIEMDKNTRNSLIAAAVIMGGFGLLAFEMPKIMLAVGEYSTAAAGVIAVAFVLAFFLVFYLRGRSRNGG